MLSENIKFVAYTELCTKIGHKKLFIVFFARNKTPFHVSKTAFQWNKTAFYQDQNAVLLCKKFFLSKNSLQLVLLYEWLITKIIPFLAKSVPKHCNKKCFYRQSNFLAKKFGSVGELSYLWTVKYYFINTKNQKAWENFYLWLWWR